jgi:hypothetical protein
VAERGGPPRTREWISAKLAAGQTVKDVRPIDPERAPELGIIEGCNELTQVFFAGVIHDG